MPGRTPATATDLGEVRGELELEYTADPDRVNPAQGMNRIRRDIISNEMASRHSSLTGRGVTPDPWITVDEHGAAAAAATGAEVSAKVDRAFLVHRPFVFFLYDHITGSVLFLGRVADPTKSS